MTTALGVLLPGFEGLEAPDWLRRAVAEGLGGVVLFARNVRSPEQVAALVAALRAEREDVLVAIDEEGGDVTRLDAATGSSTPGNLALGAAGDVELTEQVAAEIGSRLAELGIDLDLAQHQGAAAEALVAGVDALCLGGTPRSEADLEEFTAALAVVPESRLTEAAGRISDVSRWAAQGRASRPPAPAGAGAEAARRALRYEGEVRVGPQAAVVRLDPPAPWAAGPVPWGLGGEVPLESMDGRPLVLR